jgi:hypothetical protein
VVQITPYAPRPSARATIAASLAGLGSWALARSLLPASTAWVGASLALAWVTLASLAWWLGRRRARQRLELYVGDHRCALVWSTDGVETGRQERDLTEVLDTEARPGRVAVKGPAGTWVLPMEGHSDEAVAWMVEHLREAGRGARKRS